LHLEFSSNVATAIGGDGGGVKLVIWISGLRRESACRKGHAMREAARRYSMIRFTLLGMTQILSLRSAPILAQAVVQEPG